MKTSILINNFNYGQYIKETIDSVLSQNYQEFEIIVYDDGSTDNSLEVLSEFEDSRVQILANSNFGKHPSLNQAHAIEEAFNLSTGEIIFLLDSDDLFSPGKIARVMALFLEHQEIIGIQHTFQLIDQDSKELKLRKRPIVSGVKLPDAMFFSGRLDFFFSQTSALAFRRVFLEKVLPFQKDELNLLWPDLRLTRNAIFIGKILTLQEDLGKYRVHSTNDSAKLKDKKYFNQFSNQHLVFFNRLALINSKRKFRYKNKIKSILLIFLLVVSSKMSIKEKLSFFNVFLFLSKN